MIGFLLDGTLEKTDSVTADVRELQDVFALPSAFAVYRDIALGN